MSAGGPGKWCYTMNLETSQWTMCIPDSGDWKIMNVDAQAQRVSCDDWTHPSRLIRSVPVARKAIGWIRSDMSFLSTFGVNVASIVMKLWNTLRARMQIVRNFIMKYGWTSHWFMHVILNDTIPADGISVDFSTGTGPHRPASRKRWISRQKGWTSAVKTPFCPVPKSVA